jgi:hypothetical protein
MVYFVQEVTMENERIERYILSVVNILPKYMREDIRHELQAKISEMLKKRCGDADSNDHDVRVVLAELGEPLELAEKYSPNPIALISGAFYVAYIITLKIVFISVGFGVLLASMIELFSNNDIAWYTSLLYLIGRVPIALFMSFGITTLVFAIVERAKNIRHTR